PAGCSWHRLMPHALHTHLRLGTARDIAGPPRVPELEVQWRRPARNEAQVPTDRERARGHDTSTRLLVAVVRIPVVREADVGRLPIETVRTVGAGRAAIAKSKPGDLVAK